MKISELIEHLATLLTENGDIEVRCWENDGQVKRKVPEVYIVEENGKKLVQIDAQ